MKKIMLIGLTMALMSLTLLSGRGQGGERVNTGMIIAIDQLDEISTSSSWELTIEEGNREELIIDSASSRSWIRYEGGKLSLGEDSGIGLHLAKNRATLTVNRLSASLSASSSSDIMVNMNWEGNELIIRSSSSGAVSLEEVIAQKTEIRSSSSGKVSLNSLRTDSLLIKGSSSSRTVIDEGVTNSLDSVLSSSARFSAEDFMVKNNLNVRGSSSSYQEFSVADSIDAQGSLSSSGRLVLHGNPSARTLQEINTSSSGRMAIR